MVGYPSGQRGQTVNLLAYAFGGSNPPPTTTRVLADFFKTPALSLDMTRRTDRPNRVPELMLVQICSVSVPTAVPSVNRRRVRRSQARF